MVNKILHVSFEVLTMGTGKSMIWVVMQYSLVQVHQHSSKISLDFYPTTWHCKPRRSYSSKLFTVGKVMFFKSEIDFWREQIFYVSAEQSDKGSHTNDR
jgi:hypothetical protein